MVKGIEKFIEFFKDYSDSYVVIGGTACDIILSEAGLTPRATKDIDMILVVEALNSEFVRKFWEFIKEGKYGKNQNSPKGKNYYRFINPANNDFPEQLELFSRSPDIMEINPDVHLTPVPVSDDISSLSAILMNDGYYNYTISNSSLKEGISYASPNALICLKVKAFLDLTERRVSGESIDNRKIKKHKTDIFRLATLFAEEDRFPLPDTLKSDLSGFVEIVQNDLPGKELFKNLGIPEMDIEELFQQFKRNFMED